MQGLRTFLNAGHAPTLGAAFFYFACSCGIWVINGTLAPFITEAYQLSAAQKGLMLSIPIIAGSLMRFPLGLLAQYIGRKNATVVEMAGIAIAMLYGFFVVNSYHDLLALGVLLGIAGASFGVALSLGAGSFPPQYKGLAMGLVGAGNIGTAVAALLAPPLAQSFGWQAVYGIAAVGIVLPMAVMLVFAKEPDDRNAHGSLREHVACLFEKDGWAFSLIYAITFGGFIGLVTFLPSYFYEQFGVSKVQAGQLTMLAALVGALTRVAGGWLADRFGGINILTLVLAVVVSSLLLCGMVVDSLWLTMLCFLLCFSALGAGNGALFQLVPLRWPGSTAVAGSMIGEIGALGGGVVPLAMGLSQQYSGSFFTGFALFAGAGCVVLVMLRIIQGGWVQVWAGEGGRARAVA